MREKIEFLKKPGCHLCEEALETLNAVCRRLGLSFETVDIDVTPGYAEFAEDIPVLLIDGRKALKHRFEVKEVEKVLGRRTGLC